MALHKITFQPNALLAGYGAAPLHVIRSETLYRQNQQFWWYCRFDSI